MLKTIMVQFQPSDIPSWWYLNEPWFLQWFWSSELLMLKVNMLNLDWPIPVPKLKVWCCCPLFPSHNS